MNTTLAPGVSLFSEISEYLLLADIARTRAVNRFMKWSSVQRHGAWRARVKRAVTDVRDCGVCRALLRTRGPLGTLHKSAEWCALCDNLVCVDHLRQCYACSTVFCGQCGCC